MSTPLPLHGQRVIVTRAAHQAENLCEAFASAGATVATLPLLTVLTPRDPRPLDAAAADLDEETWLLFTSANAVDAFLPRVPAARRAALTIAVVGPATGAAVREHGGEPRLEAVRCDAEGLAAALAPRLTPGQQVILPQADDARPTLAATLDQAGVAVRALVAYRKGLPPEAPAMAARLFNDQPLGWVTFTSPRIVEHFVALLGSSWPGRRQELRAVSIGRVTSTALRAAGVEPAAEAHTPSSPAMVEAVLRCATAKGDARP